MALTAATTQGTNVPQAVNYHEIATTMFPPPGGQTPLTERDCMLYLLVLLLQDVDLSSLWAHTAPRELSQEQAIPSELAALPDTQARLSLLVSHTRRANCQKQRALTSCT